MKNGEKGCVYTKPWIVKFMLDCCGYTSDRPLSKLVAVDPCCGDGGFVVEMASRLCDSIGDGSFSSLKNSIRAFDVDSAAVEKAKEKVRGLLLSKGVPMETVEEVVSLWFSVGDFVGQRTVCDADLVIGNPPYIRSKDIPFHTRRSYASILEAFTAGSDMYMAFLEKGVGLLSSDGRLCFICPDRWLQNRSGARLRAKMRENGIGVKLNCRMYDTDAFEDKVSAYPSVLVLERGCRKETLVVCNGGFSEDDASSLSSQLKKSSCSDAESYSFVHACTDEPYPDMPSLERSGVSVGIGIATGKDSVFITDDRFCVEPERMLPLAFSKDVEGSSFPNPPERWLVDPWKDGSLVDLDRFPRLKAYLKANEERLRSRHVAQKSPDQWYRTIDKPKEGLLERKKLLLRDISNRPDPIYEGGMLYPHHNLYWMISDEWDLKVLGGVLISDTVAEMMDAFSVKMNGGAIRNQAQYLRRIKVPMFESLSTSDRETLRDAFERKDRSLASDVCRRLYGKGGER